MKVELLQKEPFIKLPFNKQDFTKQGPVISQGFLYDEKERTKHGRPKHWGIDFACEQGTPVHAPCNGFALSSEHISFDHAHDGSGEIGYGLGKFVVLLHQMTNGRFIYLMHAHLDSVAAEIVHYRPKWEKDECSPIILYQNIADFLRCAQRIKAGQILGTVGSSGLAKSRKPGEQESWDIKHLHLEMFMRQITASPKYSNHPLGVCDERQEDEYSKDPEARFDPFGIYAENDQYENALIQVVGSHDMWIRDQIGRCLFAA